MTARVSSRVMKLVFSEVDRARREIEGALHDGIQQDLVATSVSLQLALQVLETDPAAARKLLEELEQQVVEALERVRGLAHDIYPSLLPARGLGDALRGAGAEVGEVGRYALEVEEAVYFACDALRPAATRMRVWNEDGEIRIEAVGSFDKDALAHAQARIAAVGGQLTASAGGVSAVVSASSSAR